MELLAGRGVDAFGARAVIAEPKGVEFCWMRAVVFGPRG